MNIRHSHLRSESELASHSPEPHYNQARLLNALLAHFGYRRDSHLADKLGMSRPMICKLRKGTIPVGAALLIRMHEVSGLSIRALRVILGDRRKRFRGGYQTYSAKERIRVINERAIAASQSEHLQL